MPKGREPPEHPSDNSGDTPGASTPAPQPDTSGEDQQRIHEAYQKLGHLGGEATSESHGHEFYKEIGHKGGEARKLQMAEGEIFTKGPPGQGRTGEGYGPYKCKLCGVAKLYWFATLPGNDEPECPKHHLPLTVLEDSSDAR